MIYSRVHGFSSHRGQSFLCPCVDPILSGANAHIYVLCFTLKPTFLSISSAHIKLCLLLWFEFFRTIALLLGALRDLIVGYSKSTSASVKCRREIFARANFHPRIVALGINVSSKVGDDGRRTGEGEELRRPTEKTPRHYSLDFSTSISSVYTDVLNLGILLLDIFTKRKNKVSSQIFKICFLVNFVFKT